MPHSGDGWWARAVSAVMFACAFCRLGIPAAASAASDVAFSG
jgi:hypothetical protein